MTREDAISILNVIVHMLESKYDTDRVEDAVDMAIKALEQMPCKDATNGEVLLKMFPPSVYYGDNEKHWAILTKDCELTCLNNEWWNAPYKVESEKKA